MESIKSLQLKMNLKVINIIDYFDLFISVINVIRMGPTKKCILSKGFFYVPHKSLPWAAKRKVPQEH